MNKDLLSSLFFLLLLYDCYREVVSGNIRNLRKTKLTVSLGTIHQVHIVLTSNEYFKYRGYKRSFDGII